MEQDTINAVNDGLKAVLASQERMNARLDKQQAEFDARVARIEEQSGTHADALSKLDKALRDGRFGRGAGESGSVDALREVLPESARRAVAMHQIRGDRDPVLRAGMDAWVRNCVRLQLPMFARNHPRYIEENDKLAKAFGSLSPFGAEFRAATQEDTDTEGGHAIPAPHAAELLRLLQDAGIARQLARVVPMASKTLDWPQLNANVTATIIAEEGSITQSDPTFTNAQLVARKFASFGVTSLEMIEDALFSWTEMYMTLFAEQIALKEDQQMLEGDGTGSNWTGLVAASGTNSVTNGANGAAPSFAKIVEQKWKGAKRSTRNGASWVTSPLILDNIEALVDSQGQPIFKDDGATLAFLRQNGNSVEGQI
jgi:HK97 family phage major capsid protein